MINIPYISEIQKDIQIKELLILTMDLKVELIGQRFIVKDNRSYYFDSIGGQPDKFLLNQLPKPIIYHSYIIQGINPKLCGFYCLYFHYLIERTNH